MKRIGFFGGCFNPPTNKHIEIANNLIKQGKLDKVIFVPVNDYYKKVGLISQVHRFNMLKLISEAYEKIEVDDIEIKQDKKLFASDIFKIIEKEYTSISNQNTEIYLIMGSDNYRKMPAWKNYDIIKDKYNYIVIDRDKNDVSSTRIREMIKNNDNNVKEYLPEEVYKYILENKLYQVI